MEGFVKTGTVLDKILARKSQEVEELKRAGIGEAPARTSMPGKAPGLAASLLDRNKPGRPIIAEIKKASPSEGVIRDPFNPAAIAMAYADNGARCVSVLTDSEFFQGSVHDLYKVREATALPVLRKDFIIDRVQIEESVNAGADAVLLICRALSDPALQELYGHAISHGLDVLIEVHDEKDLDRAAGLEPAPALIGINNRDLTDFSVSVERTLELMPRAPEGAAVVSESGLTDTKVLDELLAAGVRGFLIGTRLMRSHDPGKELYRLVYG